MLRSEGFGTLGFRRVRLGGLLGFGGLGFGLRGLGLIIQRSPT